MKIFMNKNQIINNKFINNLLLLNTKMLPLIVILSFSLFFLETYTYSGFVGRRVGFDVSNLLFATAISAFIELVRGFFKIGKENRLVSLIYKINKIAFPFILFVYLALNVLESINYVNYVFTRFHLHPQNFYIIFLLSSYLLLINYLRKSKEILKRTHEIIISFLEELRIQPFFTILEVLLLILLIIFVYKNFITTFKKSVDSNMYILANLDASYEDKMREKWGLLYEVMVLIQNNTPAGSNIIIPPMGSPHNVDGRKQYYKYFMPDRYFVNYETEMDINEYDYVVISDGFLDSIYDGEYDSDYIWPSFSIDSKKTLYFDRISFRKYKQEVTYGYYNPKELAEKNVWGLIEVRKDQP